MRPDQPQAGFTLVEVLVALMVTALLLTVIFDGVATSQSRLKRSTERQEAAVLASEVLGRAAAADYKPGTRSGESNGRKWELEETVAMADPRGQFVLAQLTATIFDRHGRKISSFATRRLKVLARA